MKKYVIILIALSITAISKQIVAQTGENGFERFYNVESYKAKINLTFQYRLSHEGTENSRLTIVSQTFQHFFTSAPGQITAADMFQVERGDKVDVGSGDNASQDGGIMGGMDMDAISQALENSGIETIQHEGEEVNVMDMLKQAQKETQSYNMDLNKYKMWMAVPLAGGTVESSIYSDFYDKSTGPMLCGNGSGTFTNIREYKGSAHMGANQNETVNPNGFILLVNLANNSYSFSANVEMPPGFKFEGNLHESSCGTSSNKPLSVNARSFINIRAEKEGLVYKSPLPAGGMILSGSEIISDRFNLWGSLDKEANWQIRVDWTIYPANMEVPEVFINLDDIGKKWIPEDGNGVEAFMEWDGNYKPEIIEWELFSLSNEPGTCLNSQDTNTDPDLEFDESMKDNGYSIVRTEQGYIARKEGNVKVGNESVRLKSKDFGSYGLLSGKIRVNGIWCEAEQKELGKSWLTVPWDENDNSIADAWEKDNLPNDEFPNSWDEEEYPVLDGDPGDGISLFEEYRGLMAKEEHVRLDPNTKELIVENRIGDEIQPGLDLFEKASKIKIIVLNESELPETRIVNSNHATGYNLDQYGVVFKKGNFSDNDFTIAGAYPLETLNKTPKETQYILVNESVFNINTSNTTAGNNPGGNEIPEEDKCALSITPEVFARFRNETIAHELGHAVGANHHGDVDAYGETLSNISIDRTAFDLKGDTIKTRPLKICSPVGKKHGQASGSMSCLMRYNNLYLWRYESSRTGTIDYYQIKDEAVLNTFCTSDAGGSNPFGDATPGQGNCLGRLRVKDNFRMNAQVK